MTFYDDRNSSTSGNDIYGQYVNSNGSLYGTASNENFVILDADDDQWAPIIAYNSNFSNFIVAFTTNERGPIDIGTILLGPPCCLLADINNDITIDISDVILVLRMALGLDPPKQCPCPPCQ